MAEARFSPTGRDSSVTPPLLDGESEEALAEGVMLGWQARTVLIWWVPGLVFIALAWYQFRSLAVTVGLLLFCGALFLFYASDREVRPQSSRKRYVLTRDRLLIGQATGRRQNSASETAVTWRALPLGDIASVTMEDGLADVVVARLSGAATIVLQLRAPGPKGEHRRLRIGPMREPYAFRERLETLCAAPNGSPAAGGTGRPK